MPGRYRNKNKGFSRLSNLLTTRRYSRIAFIFVFAVAGTYFLGVIYAQQEEPKNRPERGVVYNEQSVAKSGPCKGRIEHKHELATDHPSCLHIDPGPPGVDVRERVKNIDKELDEQVKKDKIKPPKASDDPTLDESDKSTVNDLAGPGSLGEVSPRNWPCYGTGTDGNRVQWVFAHSLLHTDARVNTWRSSIESIARRVNNTFYLSGLDSGRAKQVRFVTDSSCNLSIPSVTITGNLDDFNNIAAQLRSKGFNKTNRKYIVTLEGGFGCGIGELIQDDSWESTNRNNKGNFISVIWKQCWNYAEPHELMHMLGAVQKSAPHATDAGHCWDQSDIMCYDDGGEYYNGKRYNQVCSTASFWRFDCKKDDYFNSFGATGYLSNHWNTAKNSFLK